MNKSTTDTSKITTHWANRDLNIESDDDYDDKGSQKTTPVPLGKSRKPSSTPTTLPSSRSSTPTGTRASKKRKKPTDLIQENDTPSQSLYESLDFSTGADLFTYEGFSPKVKLKRPQKETTDRFSIP